MGGVLPNHLFCKGLIHMDYIENSQPQYRIILKSKQALYTNVTRPQVHTCSCVCPSHHSRLSQSTRFELPEPYSKFPLAIQSTRGNCISFNASLSVRPTLPFLPRVHKALLYRLRLHALQIESSVPSF